MRPSSLPILLLLPLALTTSALAEPARIPVRNPADLVVDAPRSPRVHSIDMKDRTETNRPLEVLVPERHVPAAGGAAGPTGALGVYGLAAVENTHEYPWSAVAHLSVTWPSGVVGQCSGTMVGPATMLSAAHCVWDPSQGGWATAVVATPGRSGTGAPFGTATVTRIAALEGYTANAYADQDLAVLDLDQPLGQLTGFFGVDAPSDETLTTIQLRLAGYPAHVADGHTLASGAGPVGVIGAEHLEYHMDQHAGMSGGPAWAESSQGRYIVGVVAWIGYEVNGATRITGGKLDFISKALAQNAICPEGECAITLTAPPAPVGPSCAGACGDPEDRGGCYCDAECATYGDCCADYQPMCLTPPTSAAPPASVSPGSGKDDTPASAPATAAAGGGCGVVAPSPARTLPSALLLLLTLLATRRMRRASAPV